jgi:hypothetical protein
MNWSKKIITENVTQLMWIGGRGSKNQNPSNMKTKLLLKKQSNFFLSLKKIFVNFILINFYLFNLSCFRLYEIVLIFKTEIKFLKKFHH